jgi:ketosteroid isomerase-like protein
MTEEQNQLIRDGYRAINERDADWLRAHADDELEFRSRFSGLAGRTYRGKQGFEEWLADTADSWEAMEQTPERLIELDDSRIIADVRFKGRGKASGIEVDQRIAVIFTLRGERVLRMDAYGSLEEALEAAGASD